MGLDRYRRPRLLVMNKSASAFEAARAMADHGFGCVLVAEGRDLVGVVTDRDLALEVVGGDLGPRSAPLGDLMSEPVASLDVGADVDEVLRGMREHGVRRLVVTEDGLPVGIVTLDDLLLDEAIDVGQARGVLVPQFEGAAAFGDRRPGDFDARVRARRRRRARMESSYARLVRGVEHHTGLGSRERAERALEIVVGAVCRRLMPEEARHFVAQLPAKMHPDLAACFDGPDKRITARSIELELGRALTLEDRAYDVLCATCAAVADAVSGGAMDAVRGQLPAGMKELFPAPPIRRAV